MLVLYLLCVYRMVANKVFFCQEKYAAGLNAATNSDLSASDYKKRCPNPHAYVLSCRGLPFIEWRKKRSVDMIFEFYYLFFLKFSHVKTDFSRMNYCRAFALSSKTLSGFSVFLIAIEIWLLLIDNACYVRKLLELDLSLFSRAIKKSCNLIGNKVRVTWFFDRAESL